MFHEGDAVICIDASDLPPPWHPLECGKTYVIRSIDFLLDEEGNYNANIHKHANYVVRLWGVLNSIAPYFNKERGYADSRFIGIDDTNETEYIDTSIPVSKVVVLEAA
jgi:hypothetical protein